MDRDNLLINHIRDAITAIESHTKGISQDEFFSNKLVQDGVIRQILVVGEATNHLSESFKEKHFQIPWFAITGMRNQLVHGYFQVDIKEVWKTVTEDIPMLKTEIEKL
ncbi:MAG: DUF86 domain-containing protein [Parcubacteria group bacterium]